MTTKTILPEHTQKGDMRLKDGKLWVCSDPDINRWVCPDDRGWQLVPKEPTQEMIVVFVEQWYCHKQTIDDPQMGDAYQAMLEAAPKFGEEECTG